MTKSWRTVARLLEADPQEDPWTFRTSLKTDEIELEDVLEPESLRNTAATLEIVWQVDFDVREWGIKEMTPTIKSITGVVSVMHEDTDEVVDRIPIMYGSSTEADTQQLQTLMGTQPPREDATAKDWIHFYGGAQHDWNVETESDFVSGGQTGHSLYVRGATINVKNRAITIKF